MSVLASAVALVAIATVLSDAFETIVQPRRVTRRFRLARFFYQLSWGVWSGVARRLPPRSQLREDFLGLFGPLGVLVLFGVWVVVLVLSFALLQWGLGAGVSAPGGDVSFGTLVYFSGTNFFTLGLGEVTPQTGPARVATVLEGATGFTFLALIIGYIPAIFAGFSRREVAITLLDGRAGSPPSALALLQRHGRSPSGEPLSQLLREWETWAADLLQNYLSYPILAYFRSQHDAQSWLAALTMMLDTSALLVVGIGDEGQAADEAQARLTFTMARHAAGDLSQVLDTMPRRSDTDRLSRDDVARLRAELAASGLPLREGEAADRQLAALRGLYEPYVAALAEYLMLDLPPWIPAPDAVDDWETTAWEHDYRLARAALNPSRSEAGADTA